MRTLVGILIAVLFLIIGLAAAQDTKDVAKDKQDKTKPAPPLTHASLLQKLKQLGHEPVFPENTKNINRLTIQLSEFQSVFDVSLSADEKTLWLLTYTRVLSDLDAIPAAVLRDLLKANVSLAPIHFVLHPKGKRVYLQRQTPNRAFDNAELREMIDSFAEAIKRHHSKWTYPVLQPAPEVKDTQQAAELRKPLLGEWSIDSLTQDGTKNPADSYTGVTYRFFGTSMQFTNGLRVPVSVEAKGKQLHLDVRSAIDENRPCLAELEGDTLTICLPAVNGKRPEKMTGEKGSNCSLLVLKRKK